MTSENTGTAFFAAARQERIMQELRIKGSVRTRDLAQLLEVTDLTIRRDINSMAERGLLVRVHGGATIRHPRENDEAGPLSRFRLGMVVPSLTYYWPRIVNGAREQAARTNSQLILRASSYDVADDRRQVEALVQAGVHGLIVAPETIGPKGQELLRWLDALPVPVVLAERRVPGTMGLQSLEWVTTDHEFGAILGTQHLYEQGHRKIGMLIARDSPTSAYLRRGWLRALAEHDLDSSSTVEATISKLESPKRDHALAEIYRRVTETNTTALFVHSDPQALILENYFQDRGMRIGHDIAILTYDDEVAVNGIPPITALRPRQQEIGQMAVDMLVSRLVEGDSLAIRRMQTLPELFIRESTVPHSVPQ